MHSALGSFGFFVSRRWRTVTWPVTLLNIVWIWVFILAGLGYMGTQSASFASDRAQEAACHGCVILPRKVGRSIC